MAACDKTPLDCTPQVERMRGFTFCHFSNQSSTLYDTSKVNVNPSSYQGKNLDSTQITAVAINFSDFDHIPDSVFTNFGDVTRLKIMHSTIKEIQPENFLLAPHLRVLEIEYSKIGKILPKAFQHAKNLQEIKIENCNIENLAEDAFEGLENLRKVHVNGKAIISELP